jgi:interleukin-1 receptor-associated kinase 1
MAAAAAAAALLAVSVVFLVPGVQPQQQDPPNLCGTKANGRYA